MGTKIGDLFWKITADTKKATDEMNKLDDNASGLQKTFKGVSTFLKGAFVAAAVAGIAKVSAALITAASDAEETRNKFNVTFKDVRKEADATAEALADGYGLSSQKAQQLIGDTGDLLTGFGFTGEAALDLSGKVNELAVDLASFTNFSGGAEGASAALTKGLLGERESLKSLGISILEADVQAQVLKQSQEGLTFETERQAKAFATLTLAQQQSQNAIGDFARSEDSFANQTRIAKAAVGDLSVELGKQLLPIATQAVSVFAKIATALADSAKEFNDLKAIIDDFNEDGNITGGLDDLIAKRDLLIKKQQDYGREASLAYNEELQAINKAIEAAENRAEAEARAAGQRELGNLIAAEEAEKEAQRFADEEERARIRAEEIAYRDELWSQTEEARRAALEAEIAELETYKESDERAQQALAYLREELKGMTEDTEELEEAQTKQTRNFTAEIEKNNQAVAALAEQMRDISEITVDWEALQTQAITSTLAGFSDLGEALVNGENGYKAFGKAALGALAEVLRALGAQLAAEAAVATVGAIMGKVTDIPAIAIAAAGSAAAYTAAGVIGAAASNITSTPSAPATTTTPSSSSDSSRSTGSTSSGGRATFILNIDGKKISETVADYANNGIVEFAI